MHDNSTTEAVHRLMICVIMSAVLYSTAPPWIDLRRRLPVTSPAEGQCVSVTLPAITIAMLCALLCALLCARRWCGVAYRGADFSTLSACDPPASSPPEGQCVSMTLPAIIIAKLCALLCARRWCGVAYCARTFSTSAVSGFSSGITRFPTHTSVACPGASAILSAPARAVFDRGKHMNRIRVSEVDAELQAPGPPREKVKTSYKDGRVDHECLKSSSGWLMSFGSTRHQDHREVPAVREPSASQVQREMTEVKQPLVDEPSPSQAQREMSEMKQPLVDEPSSSRDQRELTEVKPPLVDEQSSSRVKWEMSEVKPLYVGEPNSSRVQWEMTEAKPPLLEEASAKTAPVVTRVLPVQQLSTVLCKQVAKWTIAEEMDDGSLLVSKSKESKCLVPEMQAINEDEPIVRVEFEDPVEARNRRRLAIQVAIITPVVETKFCATRGLCDIEPDVDGLTDATYCVANRPAEEIPSVQETHGGRCYSPRNVHQQCRIYRTRAKTEEPIVDGSCCRTPRGL